MYNRRGENKEPGIWMPVMTTNAIYCASCCGWRLTYIYTRSFLTARRASRRCDFSLSRNPTRYCVRRLDFSAAQFLSYYCWNYPAREQVAKIKCWGSIYAVGKILKIHVQHPLDTRQWSLPFLFRKEICLLIVSSFLWSDKSGEKILCVSYDTPRSSAP